MGVKLEPFTTWSEFVALAEKVNKKITLSGSENKFRLPVLGITHKNNSGNSTLGLFMYPKTTGNGRFQFVNDTGGVYNLTESTFADDFVGGGFMVVPD